MRLCDLLGVDDATATQTYYGCLLFYIGCTTDAEIAAELFDDGALVTHFNPAIFGSPFETMAGIARALAGTGTVTVRTVRVARRLPRAVRGHRRHIAAMCEVARMLTERLGLPPDVRELFGHLTERWDGKGEPAGLAGDEIPLPLRIIHVARDAALQHLLGGEAHAARVVGERGGHAFDPAIASVLVGQAGDILAEGKETSAWQETLAREPRPHLFLSGQRIGHALAAMGDFADLLSPSLVGHSAGVAALATAAARQCGWPDDEIRTVGRAALVHDLGRVAVSARIWQKPGPLTADEWERVRLNRTTPSGYWAAPVPGRARTGRRRSPRAARRRRIPPRVALRGDRPAGAPLGSGGRLPRDDRAAALPGCAAAVAGPPLTDEARTGGLDGDSVAAVLAAAGRPGLRLRGLPD